MSKIERKSFKIFGETASEENIGQFGSAIAGTKLNTGDIEEIQALEAWSKGWESATVGENRYPAMQERTGVDKVFSYQIAYMLQQGIPEWGETTNYAVGSVVKIIKDGVVSLYTSLTNNNVGNAVTDTAHWQIMGQANIDLSNLSEAGQAKLDSKVSKSGDTMTAPLTISTESGGHLQGVKTNIKLGDTPSVQANIGGFRCYAGEPVEANLVAIVQGFISTRSEQSSSGIQIITRKPDNSGWGATLRIETLADGQFIFDFPKCITKATTTSSASSSRVAVVVQNYASGTSWYRVWSDGWIEQGGTLSTTTNKTVTFLKAFSNTNYNLTWATTTGSYASDSKYWNGGRVSSKTTTNFVYYTGQTEAPTIEWHACGY